MGSKWKKAKLALGLNLCVFVPRTLDDDVSPPPSTEVSERLSDAALLSPANWDMASSQPTTPVPSFYGLKLSKSGSTSSKVCVFYCANLLLLWCCGFSMLQCIFDTCSAWFLGLWTGRIGKLYLDNGKNLLN